MLHRDYDEFLTSDKIQLFREAIGATQHLCRNISQGTHTRHSVSTTETNVMSVQVYSTV